MGKSAFEQKLDVLHVQRAEIFQDSLDELPTLANQPDMNANSKRTQVINEEGQLCEVIFDPVLKCYYEPTQNVYYQVKDVK